MCDVFSKRNLVDILHGKSLLFLGDSIMRNIYKDFVWMASPMTKEGLIPRRHLIEKGEMSFLGDHLIDWSKLTTGRHYRELRDYYCQKIDVQFSFNFITSVFSHTLGDLLNHYKEKFGSYPDAIFINSALWDINRWGPDGIHKYKNNIRSLMNTLKKTVARYTQVVWITTPPVSVEIRGGFLIPELEFQKESMRFNIMEANLYAATVVASYGYDVLDLHYHFIHQIHRRALDGIHWHPDAVRMQTNLILTHFCLSREIPLPGNWRSASIDRNLPLEEAEKIANAAYEDVKSEVGKLGRPHQR